MSNEKLSLRERAKISFFQRKKDAVARAKFLKEAQILDSNGNLDKRYFSETYSQSVNINPNRQITDSR